MIETEVIADIPFIGLNVEVTNVNWNFDQATIDVYCPDKKESIKLFFNNEFGPCSLRLLDEADLSDYWTNLNMRNGWLHKVKSGGWFEAESQRKGFIAQHSPDLQEYLVLGLDMCVSIITKENVRILSVSNSELYTVDT